MITHVAIRKENGAIYVLPKPARHGNFWASYNEDHRKDGWDFPWAGWPDSEGLFDEGSEQGFADADGNFFTREEAEVYARSCGQLKKPIIGGVLTSEDLW